MNRVSVISVKQVANAGNEETPMMCRDIKIDCIKIACRCPIYNFKILQKGCKRFYIYLVLSLDTFQNAWKMVCSPVISAKWSQRCQHLQCHCFLWKANMTEAAQTLLTFFSGRFFPLHMQMCNVWAILIPLLYFSYLDPFLHFVLFDIALICRNQTKMSKEESTSRDLV